MASKSLHFCNYNACPELTANRYCPKHQKEYSAQSDRKRGSAQERGYDSRWQKYAAWFLSQPENQLCALRLDDGCALVAQCVDHIDPPNGPDDPRFWDESNWQPSCIHCNSVKGRKKIVGAYGFGG